MEKPSDSGGETNLGSNGTGGGRPVNKGKSCKGTLYYSSIRKSREKNPMCWGFSRSLPQVNSKLVRETEAEARTQGNNLENFKYICIGYSMYLDKKNKTCEQSEDRVDLPFCVGIEILADKRPNPDYAAAHANREANQSQPQPQRKKRFNSPIEFLESYENDHPLFANVPLPNENFCQKLNRFQKCSGLVASGVASNMSKVGGYIKESIDDILFPYRKRPK